MKLQFHFLAIRAVSTILVGAALTACGSGSTGNTTASMQGSSKLVVASHRSQTLAVTSSAINSITDVRFESTSTSAQTNVPVTFGQVFSVGDLAAGTSLEGRLDSGAIVPLQLDVKAKHPDGSVRHAVISAVLPSLAAGETRTLALVRSTATASAPAAASALLAAGFTASFNATIGGVRYTASADQLMKQGNSTTWLAGAEANEWHVSVPLTTSAGVQHPHLAARFAIRWYPSAQKARVDVAVENNWAYEAAPQNFTYDADLVVGGKSVYAKPGMTHLHHARWRKLAWWGSAAPEVNVKHNSAYLIASRAVPNYDQSLVIPEASLSGLKGEWTGSRTEPMGVGLASPYMPMTGGRRDVGLLPGWTAMYLLSMDKRAREVTLGTADLSGSWSSHYRDKQTGHPVSLVDYPYMTILGRTGDTFNAAANRTEAFPACASADLCNSPHTPDTSHQPNLAYVPYLVTGDYYYLEELQFWGMWSAFSSNPYYRGFEKGLVHSDQVRGQAWTLRTLAEAAYITPDAHPLKSHFMSVVDANLEWFNTTYATGASTSNKLGVITNGYALVYDNGNALAPWQDDFFTSAIGHASELGFTKATNFLSWKTKFVRDRMIASGSCWIFAANYGFRVRDSENAPFYDSYAKVFSASLPEYVGMECGGATMASKLGLKPGEMLGYAAETIGYPANMQPALAYAADIGGAEGKTAWELFEKRSQKPDYSQSPQFAIKPKFASTSTAPSPTPTPAPAPTPTPTPTPTPAPTPTPSPAPTPSGWVTCASEGGTCSVSGGTTEVRYGTATAYVVKTVTGSVACSNTVFGDPAPNFLKACSIASITAMPPPTTTPTTPPTTTPTTDLTSTNWKVCAFEGGICTFAGTRQVRYGTASAAYTKTATGTIVCSNAVFGDPAFGLAKSCSYSTTPEPETWTACASEGGVCKVPGKRVVRYGVAGAFVSKVVSGSVSCSNSVFGDPKPNVIKSCSYSSIAS
jgi:hypothetical protein